MDARGVGHLTCGMERRRHVIFRRQTQRKRAEGRIKAVVKGEPRHTIQKIRRGGGTLGHHPRQNVLGQRAPRLPAVEGVGVMGQKEGAFGLGNLTLQDHRRGKPAQDRRDGSRRKLMKCKALHGLVHLKNRGWHHLVAVGVQETHGNRNDLGVFIRLPRCRRVGLGEGQRIGATLCPCRPSLMHAKPRCASLRVPAFELRQIAAGDILEHLEPILDRGGLPIVAVKVKIERAGIVGIAHQPFEHADHLGAFFIDRCGVEVVDLDKAFGPHRMGQRPLILAELAGAQHQDIFDPLDRMAAQIARELLIAKDRQTLLQAQLKPVPAGDAVAGPIVEILMRDDRLDPGEIIIRRGFGAGQHDLGVEDVQPLILHRAHVEIINRHDVEHVQIVFAPVDLLIPDHGRLQRLHPPGAAVLIAGAHPDVEIHLTP